MVLCPGVVGILCVTDESEHRFRRRSINAGLSNRNLNAFEDDMIGQIDLFVEYLAHRCHGPIDVSPACEYLGYDISSLFLSSKSLDMLVRPTKHVFVDLIAAGNHRYNICMQCPSLSRFNLTAILHPKLVASQLLRTIAKWFQYKRTRSEQKSSTTPPDRRNLLSYITSTYDPKLPRAIHGELTLADSRIFLDAGKKPIRPDVESHDRSQLISRLGGTTSATTIAAMFFYLSRYSECYNKLVSEIRAAFTSASDIRTGKALSSCTYLRACINETLRMSPPGPGTLWREVRLGKEKHWSRDVTMRRGRNQIDGHDARAPFGLLIDGHFVPEGTEVGVSIYCLHHNDAYFPDSFRFWPERWLPDSNLSEEADRERLRIMRQAFVPFSQGSRSCPGKTMAIMITGLTVAKTLWHFDFTRADGAKGDIGGGGQSLGAGREREAEFQLYDITTTIHDGPYLNFHYRHDAMKDLQML
jgi:cytochrome P450